MAMTPQEFRDKMSDALDNWDTETAHANADDLMCRVLRELGYGEGVDIFESTPKWYA